MLDPLQDRDLAVPARLFAALQTIEGMSDPLELGAVIGAAMEAVPGVASARLVRGDEAIARAAGDSLGEVRVLPLDPLGAIVLDLSDERAYRPHEVRIAAWARLIAVLLDRRAREKAPEIEHELRTLSRAVELAPVSIVITDLDANIRYVNPAFTRVTGYSANEVMGKNPRVLQSGDTPREVYLDLWAKLSDGVEWRGEFHNRKKNGEPYWEQAVVLPLVDGEGRVTHYLAVKEDITARRAAQEALTQLNADLERRVSERTSELSHAARAKDEFLATMSHELRTPLNAVLGFSEALQEGVYGELAEPQQAALRRIEDSGRHLLSLINDILDLSKVEAGKVALELRTVSVHDVCRASMQLVQGMARAKRQRTVLALDDMAGEVEADDRRLKQILVNLLSNAVKFTPDAGEVGLEVTAVAEGDRLRFTVWDTGIGISAEQMSQLFKPFVQLDSSLARHHTGTGLGLSLVRGLTELHGGTVEVHSIPGHGSRFSVVLPRSHARAPTAMPPP